MLYMQIRSPRILLRTRENGLSCWRAASYGTWRNPLQTSLRVLNTVQRLAMLGEAWGECCEKTLCTRGENARGQGREGLL